MSLPYLLGTTLETLPQQVPYLQIPTNGSDSAVLQPAPTGHARLQVGVVWGGSPTHNNDRHRSCRLQSLLPLLSIAGVDFHSLQKGDRAKELQELPSGIRIRNWDPDLKTFADTAAVIAGLDLVISVDTSVAHLAGSLGKPVWVILCANADWRWMHQRTDSPWYPTMRLFRQPQLGDWETVVAQVQQALQAW